MQILLILYETTRTNISMLLLLLAVVVDDARDP